MVAAAGMGGKKAGDREGAKWERDQWRRQSLNSEKQCELRWIKEQCSWQHKERHRWDEAGESLQILNAEGTSFKRLFSGTATKPEQRRAAVKIHLFFSVDSYSVWCASTFAGQQVGSDRRSLNADAADATFKQSPWKPDRELK